MYTGSIERISPSTCAKRLRSLPVTLQLMVMVLSSFKMLLAGIAVFVVFKNVVFRYQKTTHFLIKRMSPDILLRQGFAEADQCLGYTLVLASRVLVPAALISENLFAFLVFTVFSWRGA